AFSMALKKDGSVWAWGNDTSGELGDNAIADRSTPAMVNGLSGVAHISVGAAFAVALKGDGTVLAWGNNASGQIGNNNAPNDQGTAVQVSGLGAGSGVVDITTGQSHVIARTSTNTLIVWGRNASGQLGDGTTTQQNAPKTLTNMNAAQVSAGGAHTLVVR